MDKTLSDKIAAEAAREIHDEFFQELPEGFDDNEEIIESEIERIAAVIEKALSQSLAERDKEIEELAKKWDLWADTHLDGEALTVANKCHFDLSALLKGKAI